MSKGKVLMLGGRDLIWIKMSVFWVVAPSSLVEVYWRFRGGCCLHQQGDDEEDSLLCTRRRENLESYHMNEIFGTTQVP
jgi:hypothetical protein